MASILIFASNAIGKKMAGPAIRSWELSKALSLRHTVTLICPNRPDVDEQPFKIIAKDDIDLNAALLDADILITQSLTPLLPIKAKRHGVALLIDAYDPLPLECLEQFKQENPRVRREMQSSALNHLIFNFTMADGILCASEKQRDLWIGFLLGRKLLTPSRYDEDNSLRKLINVVPFGLSRERPQKDGPGLREKYGFKQEDQILLWGGGIWNWFDPLSLIRAMKQLQTSRPAIKLVFMGMKNPEPSVPEMEMGRRAIELAKNLGLFNRTVFFNTDWVPYHERHNHLLDATLGVSTHFDHIETRYSFRTRMLDYIWAELPIIATVGDSFAELIEQKKLGKTVPYENEPASANAIIECLDNPIALKTMKDNLREVQKDFYWEHVIGPIEKMIDHHAKTPKTGCQVKDYLSTASFILRQLKVKGLKPLFKKLFPHK